MLKNIFDILTLGEFYNESERIEIVKGRYEYPRTWKSTIKYIKRIWYGRRSNTN
jgi:hypothetical protein